MSESAAEPYVTDVPYLRTFSNDLSPASLRVAAALAGFAPPAEDDFDYLELGCGNGDTLCTLAAAYPCARFIGVDLNSEHIAFARGLAARGGLSNVRFLEGDFETLPRGDLPALDYVAMYGVLSWISAPKRAAALALASAKLKPGGVLFASYNAMPGWAAVEPLRRLMVDASAGTPGNSLDRAHRGLSVARLLRDAGAEYFVKNPPAAAMLDTMLRAGLSYAVHEYFLPDWHPMYFEDVAREMAASELFFVAQLPLFLNYRDLAIPASLRKPFEGVTDRLAFESLKDYALNQFFRRDLYVKGACSRSDEATRQFLDETPFGTTVRAEEVAREVSLSSYTLRFVGPIFDRLIPALAERPRTVAELAASGELGAYDCAVIRDAIAHLVIGDQALPIRGAAPALAPPPTSRLRLVSAYDRAVLAEPLSTGRPVVLASPATGRGVVLSVLEAMCLRAVTEALPNEVGGWVRAFAAKQSVAVFLDAGTVGDAEAELEILENEVEVFRERRVPKLVQLGIAAPDG